MPLSDLSEIASAATQIVEQHRAGQQQTDQHIRVAFRRFLLAWLVLAAASIGAQVWLAKYIREPLPSVVNLRIESAVANPLLCPGDTLKYSTTLDIDEALTGKYVIVIRNLDDGRQEWSSSTEAIYWPDRRTVATAWEIPAKLPATPTRPEREWTPGNYQREISIVSYESSMKANPQAIPFRIGADCPGVTGG